MLRLARASDGNHAFAGRHRRIWCRIFNKEFDDVLASCAQTVSIDIELAARVCAPSAHSAATATSTTQKRPVPLEPGLSEPPSTTC